MCYRLRIKVRERSSVSICNISGPFWGLDVTDLDEPISRFQMSKSVTVRPVFAELLLQIEILRLDVFLCLDL